MTNGSDLLRRNQALEAENRQLLQYVQMYSSWATAAAAGIQAVRTQLAPTYPETKAFYEMAITEIVTLERAARDVLQALSAAVAVAWATNGPETRHVLQAADNEVLATLNNLDTISRREQWVGFSAPIQTAIAGFYGELRPLIKQYLTAQDTVLAQKILQIWLIDNNQNLADLKRTIDDLPKRGRAYDAVLDLAGQMLSSYPVPKRGQNWQLVEQLYTDLSSISPRAIQGDQLGLLRLIKTDFLSNGNTVSDRRNAGVWASKMLIRWHRKTQIESQ